MIGLFFTWLGVSVIVALVWVTVGETMLTLITGGLDNEK